MIYIFLLFFGISAAVKSRLINLPISVGNVCIIENACFEGHAMYFEANPLVSEQDFTLLSNAIDRFVEDAYNLLESQMFDVCCDININSIRFETNFRSLHKVVHIVGTEKPALSFNISDSQWEEILLAFLQCFTSFHKGHGVLSAFTGIRPKLRKYSSEQDYFPGTTYYMRTGGGKHFGHFLMKALQVFSLISTKSFSPSFLPQEVRGERYAWIWNNGSIDVSFRNVLWKDYFFEPQTEYEELVWSVIAGAAVKDERKICYSHSQLESLRTREICYNCTRRMGHALCKTGHESRYRKLPTKCFRKIMFSPHQQDPFPFSDSVERWRTALNLSIGGVLHSAIQRACRSRIISLLVRSEGGSLRKMINIAEVNRTIHESFKGYRLRIVEISSRMSPIEQGLLLAESFLVVSAHSSQLWNMIFCGVGTTFLEIQSTPYSREFQQYASVLGIRYYIMYNKKELSRTPGSIHADFDVDVNLLRKYLKYIQVSSRCFERL